MDLFRARSLPYMTRRNYVYEAAHLPAWGVLVGMAEGNVSAGPLTVIIGVMWVLTILGLVLSLSAKPAASDPVEPQAG